METHPCYCVLNCQETPAECFPTCNTLHTDLSGAADLPNARSLAIPASRGNTSGGTPFPTPAQDDWAGPAAWTPMPSPSEQALDYTDMYTSLRALISQIRNKQYYDHVQKKNSIIKLVEKEKETQKIRWLSCCKG